ncbi:MAG: MFS transporter [Verrucomicrobia bacterium]|nr:MFS transporter [Verrucomicrobiota bacterium]
MPKTSTWAVLRNVAYRRLWIANLISGSAVAAHGTAAFWVINSLSKSDSTLLLPLMATLSSLPSSIFTLPAGAIADLVDRKKMLCAVNFWQASIAIGLAVLGFRHLLSGYVILASAFLFGMGFAFGSPVSGAVVAEMVSSEDLPAANVLGGLQMNIAGIIGPTLGGILIGLVGANVIFGLNGLGFLLVAVAIVWWHRVKRQSQIPLESFFESFTTAIRYVRYTPGIRIILGRSAVFAFFISIIPALMPVVGLKELNLQPANLGLLFTSMAVGSVTASLFIIPWARARYRPEQLMTSANASLIAVCILMAIIRWSKLFFLIAALAGMGWTLSATELWVAGQRAMPEWARGRMNATIIMVSQAATALGSVVWGTTTAEIGLGPTFLLNAALAVFVMIFTRLPAFSLSLDFTTDLSFEPASVAMFSSDNLTRLPDTQEGPLSITTAFHVDPENRDEFLQLAGQARLIYLRSGAYSWHLKENLAEANSFQTEIVVPSWTHHLRQRERVTKSEMEIINKLYNLHSGPDAPLESTSLQLDKEVVARTSLLHRPAVRPAEN